MNKEIFLLVMVIAFGVLLIIKMIPWRRIFARWYEIKPDDAWLLVNKGGYIEDYDAVKTSTDENQEYWSYRVGKEEKEFIFPLKFRREWFQDRRLLVLVDGVAVAGVLGDVKQNISIDTLTDFNASKEIREGISNVKGASPVQDKIKFLIIGLVAGVVAVVVMSNMGIISLGKDSGDVAGPENPPANEQPLG